MTAHKKQPTFEYKHMQWNIILVFLTYVLIDCRKTNLLIDTNRE